jgi:hypothetical protein
MALGVALGILSLVMVTLPLLRLARDAPTLTTPGSVTLHLDKGLYKVFQDRATAGTGSVHASDVSLSGPGGGALPASDAGPNEIISRGRRHYASAVAFRVPAPGDYRVRIDAARGEVVIARSLAEAVRSRVGWVAAIPIGGLLFLIGLVLLVVRIMRRRQPPPQAPPQPPPA